MSGPRPANSNRMTFAVAVNDRDFSEALRGLAFETGKTMGATLRGEARRLGIELAGLALPNAGALWGKQGLGGRARKIGEKRIFSDLNKIYKSSGAISLRMASRINDPRVLQVLAKDLTGRWSRDARSGLGEYGKKSVASMEPARRRRYMRQLQSDAASDAYARSDGTSIRVRSTRVGDKGGRKMLEEDFGSVVFRIMRAALIDPARALVNLRRFIKPEGESFGSAGSRGDDGAAETFQVVRGVGGKPYRAELNRRSAKEGRSTLIVLEGRKNTRSLISSVGRDLIRKVGSVKGGWMDSVAKIRKPDGSQEPQVDSWITGKKGRGLAREMHDPSNINFAIELENRIGNAGGIDSRLNYSKQAVRNRTAAMRKVLEAVLRKSLGSAGAARRMRVVYGFRSP